ncbi:MAG TPA: hypothetical protein VKK31_27950 [Thermoanaerobaculia bacterium]|nr:hypothetical protein [Thermoanaerobaculia bacterium]
MPVYEILLHGQGLKLLDDKGSKKEGGVYVWRVAKAPNQDLAVALAREALLREPVFLEELRNDSTDEITFTVEEIREKPFWGRAKDTGPVFYIEEDD